MLQLFKMNRTYGTYFSSRKLQCDRRKFQDCLGVKFSLNKTVQKLVCSTICWYATVYPSPNKVQCTVTVRAFLDNQAGIRHALTWQHLTLQQPRCKSVKFISRGYYVRTVKEGGRFVSFHLAAVTHYAKKGRRQCGLCLMVLVLKRKHFLNVMRFSSSTIEPSNSIFCWF